MPESILDWEIALTLWFQSQGDWLIGPMNFLTLTGGPLFFLFVLPIVYWSVNRRFGLRLALALLITLTLNSLLKIFFHAPRPYWYNADVRLLGGGETGFGLPSGHAQTSVVLWGMIAAADQPLVGLGRRGADHRGGRAVTRLHRRPLHHRCAGGLAGRGADAGDLSGQ